MASSLGMQAAKRSGDLIAVGADGRGGRIKVLRSLDRSLVRFIHFILSFLSKTIDVAFSMIRRSFVWLSAGRKGADFTAKEAQAWSQQWSVSDRAFLWKDMRLTHDGTQKGLQCNVNAYIIRMRNQR